VNEGEWVSDADYRGRTEDDDGNVYGTQDAEFICLLEQAILALGPTRSVRIPTEAWHPK